MERTETSQILLKLIFKLAAIFGFLYLNIYASHFIKQNIFLLGKCNWIRNDESIRMITTI